ncbi:hypothetical protein JOC78_001591 [Bacillus ectoiniformans]|uniref:hypothetical protein n=1 Tax=Bacillus ectoiniformans TaxID=1494429 RepID=UPI0019579F30|nr:hypothetical protein [Bacillus ectoiniformans]MBM7648645.1 hypothetical protein [Bacillus ectoiniformans]
MKFSPNEILTFEQILVQVVEVNTESVVFKILNSGYEGDAGSLMEVPLSYLEEKKDEVKRA